MVKLTPAPTRYALSGRLLALLSAQHTRVWGVPSTPRGRVFCRHLQCAGGWEG